MKFRLIPKGLLTRFWNKSATAIGVSVLMSAYSLLFHGFPPYIRDIDHQAFKILLNEHLLRKDLLYWFYLNHPYQLFQRRMASFIKTIGLENQMEHFLYFTYCVAILLTFFLLFLICEKMFQNRKTSLLFLIFYASGVRLIEVGTPYLHQWYIHPWAYSIPFALFALYLYLRKEYLWGWAVAALSMNIYLPPMIFLLPMFFINEIYLLKKREISLMAILKHCILAILLMLPIIITMFSTLEGKVSIFLLRFSQMQNYSHLSPRYFSPYFWTNFFLGVSLGLFSYYKAKTIETRHRKVANFFLTVFLIWLLTIFFTEIIPTEFVTRALPLKSIWFFNLFGLMYVSEYLRKSWEDDKLDRFLIGLTIIALILNNVKIYLASVLLILVSHFSQRIEKEKLKQLLQYMVPWLCIAFILLAYFAFTLKPEFFMKYRLKIFVISFETAIVLSTGMATIALWEMAKRSFKYSRIKWELFCLLGIWLPLIIVINHFSRIGSEAHLNQQDWKETTAWCKQHTNLDAVFIVPLQRYDFAVLAERTPFITEHHPPVAVILSDKQAEPILQRLKDVGMDLEEAIKKFNFSEQMNRINKSWNLKKLKQVKDKYDVDYFIAEKPLVLDLPRVFQNEHFVIYSLREIN